MLRLQSICRFIFIAIIALILAHCGPSKRLVYYDKEFQPENQPLSLKNFDSRSQRITIMTWNLENLYDTEDDPRTDDDTFLPLEVKKQNPKHEESCRKKGAYSWVQQCLFWDWNDNVLDKKLEQLSKVIKAVNNGKGPDILVVQEVENLKVLQMLIDGHLQFMGYTAHLIENNDLRGIDVGLITRIPPVEPVVLKTLLRSRPALSARFILPDGSPLNLLGVHFPISATPIDRRMDMLKQLKLYAEEKKNELTIAAGDFNFPAAEERHYKIIDKVKPDWAVSHLYCQDCNGTFYDSYDREFSQLDWILLSKNFFDSSAKWTLDTNSVTVFKELPMQIANDDSPTDFDPVTLTGASDHWPFLIEIVKTSL